MNLRDWYAGQVLTNLRLSVEDHNSEIDKIVDFCYRVADRFISRSKELKLDSSPEYDISDEMKFDSEADFSNLKTNPAAF